MCRAMLCRANEAHTNDKNITTSFSSPRPFKHKLQSHNSRQCKAWIPILKINKIYENTIPLTNFSPCPSTVPDNLCREKSRTTAWRMGTHNIYKFVYTTHIYIVYPESSSHYELNPKLEFNTIFQGTSTHPRGPSYRDLFAAFSENSSKI